MCAPLILIYIFYLAKVLHLNINLFWILFSDFIPLFIFYFSMPRLNILGTTLKLMLLLLSLVCNGFQECMTVIVYILIHFLIRFCQPRIAWVETVLAGKRADSADSNKGPSRKQSFFVLCLIICVP